MYGRDWMTFGTRRIPVLPDSLTKAAHVIVAHRGLVVALVLAIAAALGVGIVKLRADFTPSDLFGSVDGQAELSANFQAAFGNTDTVLLFVVRADDVYAPPVLNWVGSFAASLAAHPLAGQVDALPLLWLPPSPVSSDAQQDVALVQALQLGAAPFRAAASVVDELGGSGDQTARDSPPDSPPTAPTQDTWRMLQSALATASQPPRSPLADGIVDAEEADALRQLAVQSTVVRGRLVSTGGDTLLVAVQLADGVVRNQDVQDAVSALVATLDNHPPPAGVTVEPGGLPWLRVALISRMKADQSVLLPAAIGVCLLILFVAFRWWPALALPTAAVGLSAVMLVGGMGWVGEPFNILNNIIPLVIIVIGISDAIHLLQRFLEEAPNSPSVVEAARRTVMTMAVACFLTSFTTAVGFASLAVSETPALRHFGITAAIGVMIAYLVTVVFLPATLTWLPQRSIPKVHDGAEGRFEAALAALTRAVLRRSWWVLAAASLVLGGLVWLGLQVKIDSAVLDQFDEDDALHTTTRLIEQELGGIRPLEIYLTSEIPGRLWEPDVIQASGAVTVWAHAQSGVLSTLGVSDLLGQARRMLARGDATVAARPYADTGEVQRVAAVVRQSSPGVDPFARFVTADGQQMRLSLSLEDLGARWTIEFSQALQHELDRQFGSLAGVQVRQTGDAYVSSLGLDAVVSDLAGSLATALLIILAFLSLLFRNLRLGLLSLPPNLLPLAFVAGWMGYFGIPLNAATVIIFSVSIGLAVDGTIHVLARFREEFRVDYDTHEALVRAMRGTGKAILLTNASLLIGFGVMLVSSFVPVRLFGTLICVTVVGCTAGTLLVLPALLGVAWRSGARGAPPTSAA